MYSIFFFVLIGAFATDQPAPCHLPIDIAFLQDVTGSFKEDLPIVASKIPAIVESVQATNPGSKWAIASFQDKPYMPLGEKTDICYNLASGLKSSPSDVLKAYEGLRAGGGGDLPESQYTALINLALDKRVDWRPLEYHTTDPLKTGAKLIIMSTDAQPHMPLDANVYDSNVYPDLPKDLPAHWGGFTQDDPLNECKNFDYPSPYQVRDILKQEEITLAILTPNTNDKVVGAWKWINEDLLGQSPEMYRFIDENSADIYEEIVQIIKSLTEIECAETTTPIPSTETSLNETLTSHLETSTSHLETSSSLNETTTSLQETTTTDTSTANSTTPAECQCPNTCPETVCHCDCCDEEADLSADEALTGLEHLALKDINLKEVMLLAIPRKPKALRIDYD